jgi:hypothetical protein
MVKTKKKDAIQLLSVLNLIAKDVSVEEEICFNELLLAKHNMKEHPQNENGENMCIPNAIGFAIAFDNYVEAKSIYREIINRIARLNKMLERDAE